jgi:hypothetical protein
MRGHKLIRLGHKLSKEDIHVWRADSCSERLTNTTGNTVLMGDSPVTGSQPSVLIDTTNQNPKMSAKATNSTHAVKPAVPVQQHD